MNNPICKFWQKAIRQNNPVGYNPGDYVYANLNDRLSFGGTIRRVIGAAKTEYDIELPCEMFIRTTEIESKR